RLLFLLFSLLLSPSLYFFLFTASAPTEIYPLSLHDALPILDGSRYPILVQLRHHYYFDADHDSCRYIHICQNRRQDSACAEIKAARSEERRVGKERRARRQKEY